MADKKLTTEERWNRLTPKQREDILIGVIARQNAKAKYSGVCVSQIVAEDYMGAVLKV